MSSTTRDEARYKTLPQGTGPLWLVEKTQTSAEEEAFLAKM